MGLFGSIAGAFTSGKSGTSSSSASQSDTYNTAYDEGAVDTIKKTQQQGLNLSDLAASIYKQFSEANTDLMGSATGATKAGLTSLTDTLANSGGVSKQFYNQALNGLDETTEANKAETDVMAAMNKSNEAATRDMARYGINPATYASNARANALDTAANIIGARTQARETARDENWNRLLGAMGVTASTASTALGGTDTLYDTSGASGTAINATNAATSAAEVGLTPKSTSSKATSTGRESTKSQKTAVGSEFGFKI